jgi:hypothetical protein
MGTNRYPYGLIVSFGMEPIVVFNGCVNSLVKHKLKRRNLPLFEAAHEVFDEMHIPIWVKTLHCNEYRFHFSNMLSD